ncbi:hypothetical protein [Methylobacterium aerolatum]|uniref:Serine protease n=1 Tax=Methylobacterium aerolatum TaxID=418708 RepID=A0ABU0I0C3_9HYPH|nr:hypothetical protein [Methylobacterium aerolatum]MDQ0447493.1 hypothetical protein [Methylobacterium aerolatum]GJD34594.1 hypothetical protein FMGBMHLM_1496 [Methylobacterium aerolatum]
MSKSMKAAPTLTLAALALAAMLSPAAAQPAPPEAVRAGEAPAIVNRNNTGGEANVVVPRGATGADTFTSNSSAGGNASRPELAVPNGSTGGGTGGTR